MSFRQKAIDILREEFEIPMSVLENEAAPFQELNLDSLDVADLIVLIEKKTGKKIPLQRFLVIRTIGDVYGLMDNIETEMHHEGKIS